MSDSPVISIENANIYQRNNLVLKEVNLTISGGEFVYIIGKTGSGKSSLLRTLYCDLPLKEGKAEIVGFNLDKIKRRKVPQLRRKLGIVFQDFQLLTDRSVNDNLFFVLRATGWKDKKKIEQRIEEVLDKVGMGTKGYKMSFQLSGGEQQRVAIARALLNDPEVILADEPTGNLDPETSDNIINLLREISNNNKAVLMATHEHHFLQKFPARTLTCKEGRIVDEQAIATQL